MSPQMRRIVCAALLSFFVTAVFAKCPPGTFGKKTCKPCEPGRYSEQPNSPFCNACPPGTFGNSTGASSRSACKPCPRGTLAKRAGSTECFACPKGTYSDVLAARSCLKCPSGFFNPVEGGNHLRIVNHALQAPAPREVSKNAARVAVVRMRILPARGTVLNARQEASPLLSVRNLLMYANRVAKVLSVLQPPSSARDIPQVNVPTNKTQRFANTALPAPSVLLPLPFLRLSANLAPLEPTATEVAPDVFDVVPARTTIFLVPSFARNAQLVLSALV